MFVGVRRKHPRVRVRCGPPRTTCFPPCLPPSPAGSRGFAEPPRPVPRTLLDAGDAPSVVRLVRCLDRGGRDGRPPADRLARLYATFPPDETLLARLSLLQQAHAGEGSVEDFCASTAYALAMDAVSRGHVRYSNFYSVAAAQPATQPCRPNPSTETWHRLRPTRSHPTLGKPAEAALPPGELAHAPHEVAAISRQESAARSRSRSHSRR